MDWSGSPGRGQSVGVSRSIRVMLREMPQMLRDILEHALTGEADMELTAGDQQAAPDVVLLGTRAPEEHYSAAALLTVWPHARILAVETKGGRTSMYELRPHIVDLGSLSTSGIVEIIRMAARGEPHAAGRPQWSDDRRSH
jgi:hypothetical protein